MQIVGELGSKSKYHNYGMYITLLNRSVTMGHPVFVQEYFYYFIYLGLSLIKTENVKLDLGLFRFLWSFLFSVPIHLLPSWLESIVRIWPWKFWSPLYYFFSIWCYWSIVNIVRSSCRFCLLINYFSTGTKWFDLRRH